MPVQYANRKGDVYYLHVGRTKKGNPKYHFSRKEGGDLANAIPDGFEVYENPNAQVFLRRIKPKLVTDEEIEIVRWGVQKFARLRNFIIDVKDNAIVVHTADEERDDMLVDELARYSLVDRSGIRDLLDRSAYYKPMMQFVLIDKQTRSFLAQRWCFRGSVDDWIDLSDSEDLSELVAEYCPHLGRESFFELLPGGGTY